MTPASRMNWSERILATGWATILVCLPVTSLVVLVGGQPGNVRPVATLLAALLCPLVLLVSWRTQVQDRACRRLGVLVVWLCTIGLVALWLGAPAMPPAKPSAASLFIKAVLGLLVGVSVYLLARERLRTAADLRRAAPWIGLGAVISVALAVVQVVSQWQVFSSLRPYVVDVSSWFSAAYQIQDLPHTGRAHGVAYEPSFMASHLYLLVMPLGFWLLADGQRKRLGYGLLVLVVFGIALSGSRLGILCAITVMALGVMSLLIAKQRQVAGLATLVLIGACALSAPLVMGNKYAIAVTSVLKPAQGNADGNDYLSALVSRTSTGPRAAVAVASIHVWRDHPVSGVGLGLSPMYLNAHIPTWAFALSNDDGRREIAEGTDRESPKFLSPFGMLSRLPAEGGIIGILLLAWFLWAHCPRRLASAKLLAALAMTALLFDGLILASFALPCGWIVLAAIFAADAHE